MRGEGQVYINWLEARDAAKYLHRTDPHNKELSSLKCQCHGWKTLIKASGSQSAIPDQQVQHHLRTSWNANSRVMPLTQRMRHLGYRAEQSGVYKTLQIFLMLIKVRTTDP